MGDQDSDKPVWGMTKVLTTLGAVVGLAVGVTSLVLNWQTIFPGDPERKAGLVVTVNPSLLEMEPNGSARVDWTLFETNNVGVNVEDRTGLWRRSDETLIKSVGPIRTPWRIEPSGRQEWQDEIVLYADAATHSVDGYLILDQGFRGVDDNGNEVIGRARIRVKLKP